MTRPHPAAAEAKAVSLRLRRTIRASAERLFAAWTEPEQLKRWWGPQGVVCPEAQIDLRVGGGYRIANRFADGRVVWIVGEFKQVAPPRELVYTWRLEPPSAESDDTQVTVRFEPRGEFTEVSVMHERFTSRAFRDSTQLGWRDCLRRLADYLHEA
ncbi:MAG: SRPBCC domain-containing protein [Candidatus Lambdaproteobacteria bacterium]|nr:SRPBCC domain-containing protein [Candidatus Lambdaproteobacteria bacterium]